MAHAPDLKREAARRALGEVTNGMVLGLGTGSTVAHFLELLGEALDDGRLSDVSGVPTSIRTGREARAAGIPLVGLGDHDALDLAVDGADEVGPGLALIKGMGGALLREKMVAQAARRFVVIADGSKAVDRLGTRSPLPIEVVDWGWRAHERFFAEIGATSELRRFEDGPPYKSDNGNLIFDCTFPDGIEDPRALERRLCSRSGVVASGLFLDMADVAFLADGDGVRDVRAGG